MNDNDKQYAEDLAALERTFKRLEEALKWLLAQQDAPLGVRPPLGVRQTLISAIATVSAVIGVRLEEPKVLTAETYDAIYRRTEAITDDWRNAALQGMKMAAKGVDVGEKIKDGFDELLDQLKIPTDKERGH